MKPLKEIGLYFGSFNPVHIGHLIIADAILQHSKLDAVWFVVSPRNPHKSQKSLAHEFDRLDMVKAAIENNMDFAVTDIEFRLPVPSYTIDTLVHLSSKHREYRFSLIMGEDNLLTFQNWKNYKQILASHKLLVYPRPRINNSKKEILPEFLEHPDIVYIKAPLLEISATYIRERLSKGLPIRYLVPSRVEELIASRKLYQ